ncbi:MAG: hypothetical protein ABSE55_06660 [Terracidiphilus sp.]
MNLRANAEMPILAPVPTRAATAQVSDQSSVSFNDSLVSASKAYSEVGPKATRQPKPDSKDAVTPGAIPDGPAIQSPVVSQLTVLQQALPAQQTQLTSTVNPSTGLPLAASGSSFDEATAVMGQPIGNSEAGWTAGSKSTIAQSGVAKSAGNLSKSSQLSSIRLAQKQVSSGTATEAVNALAVSPSTTGNSVSNGVVTAPSITDPSVIQNSLQNTVPQEAANSLSQSVLNAGAGVAPNASSNAAANTIKTAASDARSSAATNGFQNPTLSAVSEQAANSLQQPTLKSAASVAPNDSSNQFLNKSQSAVPDAQSSATSNEIQNPLLNAVPERTATSLSQSALNAIANAAPNASSNPAQDTTQIVVPDAQSNTLTNAIQSPVPDAAPGEAQSSLSQSAQNAFANIAPIAPSNAASSQASIAASTAASNELQSSFLKTVLKAFASVIPNGLANAAPNTVAHVTANNDPDSNISAAHDVVANTVHNDVPNVAVNTVSNTSLNADQVSTAHAAQPASSKEGAAPVAGTDSTNRPITPAVSADQATLATGLSVPEAVTVQLPAQNLFTDGSLVASQAGLSGLNSTSIAKPSAVSSVSGKAGLTNDADDTTGLKQHAPSQSNAATFQSGSQETTQSANQSQISVSSQAQGTAASQANFASHTVVDSTHSQNAAITSPVQTSPTPSGNAGHAAITPDRAAPAATAAPQASPVVNTARLIQNVGQSEMRVGMRSNEFGNISISTSATRDSISAQISLDHGELAKTLTAHLPEIQAKLSSNQSVDVRIDSNGARGGLGAGTSGDSSKGATSDPQGSRQQAGNAASNYSGNGFSDRQFSPLASTVATNGGGLNSRLDIRV